MKMANPPAEFYKKIETKEVERASLDERLHQLSGPAKSNNLFQFPVNLAEVPGYLSQKRL
jgi:hypothetical protein